MKRTLSTLCATLFLVAILLLATNCSSGNKGYQEYYNNEKSENSCAITPKLKRAMKDLEVNGINRFGLLEVRSHEVLIDKNVKPYNLKGCIDLDGKVVIPLQYEYVSVGSRSLIIVKKDGKMGLVDWNGRTIVPCQYDILWVHGDYAIAKNNNKYGVINNRGETVVPLQYDYIHTFYKEYDRRDYEKYKFESAFWLVKDDKQSVINFSRDRKHPTTDHIDTPFDYRKMEQNGLCGYINYLGEVIPCQYQNARDFSEGLAAVVKNNKIGFIDENGDIKIPFEFDYSEYTFNFYSFHYGVFSEGVAAMLKGSKWGYIDKKGNTTISFQYDAASCFHEGSAIVGKYIDKEWRYGLIDKNNAVVLPFEFEGAVHSGNVNVMCKDGKWGAYAPNGTCLIPCEYDKTLFFFDGYATITKDGKDGLVDESGQVLIPCQYDLCGHSEFGSDLVYVKQDDKVGYLNVHNQVVVPVEFDVVQTFPDFSLFVVTKDGHRGLHDRCGNCTLD